MVTKMAEQNLETIMEEFRLADELSQIAKENIYDVPLEVLASFIEKYGKGQVMPEIIIQHPNPYEIKKCIEIIGRKTTQQVLEILPEHLDDGLEKLDDNSIIQLYLSTDPEIREARNALEARNLRYYIEKIEDPDIKEIVGYVTMTNPEKGMLSFRYYVENYLIPRKLEEVSKDKKINRKKAMEKIKENIEKLEPNEKEDVYLAIARMAPL